MWIKHKVQHSSLVIWKLNVQVKFLNSVCCAKKMIEWKNGQALKKTTMMIRFLVQRLFPRPSISPPTMMMLLRFLFLAHWSFLFTIEPLQKKNEIKFEQQGTWNKNMKVKFIQPIFDIIAEYDDDDDKKMQNFY